MVISFICHFLIIFYFEGSEDERGLSAGAMALCIHAWHNKVIPSLKKKKNAKLFCTLFLDACKHLEHLPRSVGL